MVELEAHSELTFFNVNRMLVLPENLSIHFAATRNREND